MALYPLSRILYIEKFGFHQLCTQLMQVNSFRMEVMDGLERAVSAFPTDWWEGNVVYLWIAKESMPKEGIQFRVFIRGWVQLSSVAQLCPTPWTVAPQASLSITNSQSLLKLMSIEQVMPSNHLILSRPLLLPILMFPSFRVFSNESVLCIRWPKYWSFSFNISTPINTQDWSPLGWTGWISLQSKGLSRVFSNTTVQKHQFFGTQLSF